MDYQEAVAKIKDNLRRPQYVSIVVDGWQVPVMNDGEWLPWALHWSAAPVSLPVGGRIPSDHALAVAGLAGLVEAARQFRIWTDAELSEP